MDQSAGDFHANAHQDHPRREERPAARTPQSGGTIEVEVKYSGQPEVSYIPTPYREETMSIRVSLEH